MSSLAVLALLAAARAAPVDEGEALSESWLVILASERDPATPVPALEVLRAHPDLDVAPRTLQSARFQNLMPCYTVTVALATPDKARAQALSGQLRALGVDHYLKAAGRWVGPSDAVDAYCARAATAAAGPAQVLAQAEGRLWAAVDLPEEVEGHLLAGAPAPVPISPQYDAWRQPLPVQAAGSLRVGAAWTAVDGTTGARRACTVDGFAGLTLGIPHFGVLQQETSPDAPACGRAELYARLDCGGEVPAGLWVGAPAEAGGLLPYTPAGSTPAGLAAAAQAALEADTDWDTAEADPALVEREVAVRAWEGPGGRFALVEGRRRIDGGCGGEQTTWSAVYALKGARLGRRLGGFVEASWADTRGLVDLDGDGTPERVVTLFPATTSVVDGDGAVRAEQALAYCDCPC